MTREYLVAEIAKAAGECGYAFHVGEEYRMDGELQELPAMWIIPPG